MKKYILPIVLGAGAIFYFLRKKKDVSPIQEIDETKEAVLITTPKKKAPAKKSFDVNKAINNLSKLKSSKGGQIVQKAIKKKLAQKKAKKPSNTFKAPLQPKPKAPVKFF